MILERFLFGCTILVGAFLGGCGPVALPETKLEKAYRICREKGYSQDTIFAAEQGYRANRDNGYAYSVEIALGYQHCEDSSCFGPSNPCIDCKECVAALADAVYFPDE